MVEQHGHTFTNGNIRYTLLINDQLPRTPDWANELRNVIPGWEPNVRPGFWTMIAVNGSERAVFQIDRVLNIYSIFPRLLDNSTDFLAHIQAIFDFILVLIKKYTTVKLANEVSFKIGVYTPDRSCTTTLPGNWQKNPTETSITICDIQLPVPCIEHTMRLHFNNNFELQPLLSLPAPQPSFSSPSLFGNSRNFRDNMNVSTNTGMPFGNSRNFRDNMNVSNTGMPFGSSNFGSLMNQKLFSQKF